MRCGRRLPRRPCGPLAQEAYSQSPGGRGPVPLTRAGNQVWWRIGISKSKSPGGPDARDSESIDASSNRAKTCRCKQLSWTNRWKNIFNPDRDSSIGLYGADAATALQPAMSA